MEVSELAGLGFFIAAIAILMVVSEAQITRGNDHNAKTGAAFMFVFLLGFGAASLF